MNFRKKVREDDLEINFIPLIDVLLVIIIFLVVSTTFSKFSELKINLPTAEANQVDKKIERINIAISENGNYAINESSMRNSTISDIVINLKAAANNIKDPVIVINADSNSPHQSVINVMEAARISGFQVPVMLPRNHLGSMPTQTHQTRCSIQLLLDLPIPQDASFQPQADCAIHPDLPWREEVGQPPQGLL